MTLYLRVMAYKHHYLKDKKLLSKSVLIVHTSNLILDLFGLYREEGGWEH